MNRRRKQMAPVSHEQAERAVRRHNFWTAFELLCDKIGKAREFHWYIRRRNAEATIGQITEFKRRMTRLLAFNYDVHKCPAPSLCARLKPEGTEGAEPLRFPPELNKEKP